MGEDDGEDRGPTEEEIRHAESALRANSFSKTERNSLGHVTHVNDVMAFTNAVMQKRGGAGASTRKL